MSVHDVSRLDMKETRILPVQVHRVSNGGEVLDDPVSRGPSGRQEDRVELRRGERCRASASLYLCEDRNALRFPSASWRRVG